VSGQCEVFEKCERTTELPQNAETGAPRADANDGKKAGVKLAKMLIYTYSLFGGVKRREQNPKISLPIHFRRVWGEPQIKMIGNFWVLPRASLSSAAEAQVSFVKSCGFCPKYIRTSSNTHRQLGNEVIGSPALPTGRQAFLGKFQAVLNSVRPKTGFSNFY